MGAVGESPAGANDVHWQCGQPRIGQIAAALLQPCLPYMCRDGRATSLRNRLCRCRVEILRGWANYFKHAVAKHTLQCLHTFVWWRIIRWVMQRHRMTWTAIRRWLRDRQGHGKPIEMDGITLFDLGKVPITRYRHRGNSIPSPWPDAMKDLIPTA